MKNYSSKQVKKRKLAYRTPEMFIYRKYQQVLKHKHKKGFKNK